MAMVIGTIFAVVVVMADFSKVGDGTIFAFPTPFHPGASIFDAAAIISMVIVVVVILTETTADVIAMGEIVETPVDSKRIANGLRADRLSSAIAPIFGSFSQNAFAQNVGLVAVTGVKSRFVVTFSGLIPVKLGLLPVMGRDAGFPLSLSQLV